MLLPGLRAGSFSSSFSSPHRAAGAGSSRRQQAAAGSAERGRTGALRPRASPAAAPSGCKPRERRGKPQPRTNGLPLPFLRFVNQHRALERAQIKREKSTARLLRAFISLRSKKWRKGMSLLKKGFRVLGYLSAFPELYSSFRCQYQ